MSKKIWRGQAYGQGAAVTAYPFIDDNKNNCTVIPDAACFPVKEAMAFMRAVERKVWDGDLEQKYLRAKERMKKKAKAK
jgi:hypothetical protein